MTTFPPYHPEFLVKLWLSTPVLNQTNPHVVLPLLALLVIGTMYKKKRKNRRQVNDQTEQLFQVLLQKRKVLEQRILELEQQRADGFVSTNQYESNVQEYRQHLEDVKRQLLHYTS